MWSCFRENFENISTDFDLLIITREKEKAKRDEIGRTVSKFNTTSIKFVTIVHSIDAVNDALNAGNFFFSTLYHKGVLLYARNDTSLAKPPGIAVLPSATIERWGNKCFGLGQRFLKDACYCSTQGWLELAAFMLHQSVEQTSIGLIRIYTGYRPATHRLERLLAMVTNFSTQGESVFSEANDHEIKLFRELQKAYSDSRYKDDYVTTLDTINQLIERVKKYVEIADHLYLTKLNSVDKPSQNFVFNREVLPFKSICVDTFANVVLQRGECESVYITSNSPDVVDAKLSVANDRLFLSMGGLDAQIQETTVYIRYINLDGLVVNLSGNITCDEPIEVMSLGIIQNGVGNVDLKVNVLKLDVTVAKAGNVTISGSADVAHVRNHHSGNFFGSNLETSAAHITIRGLEMCQFMLKMN